MSGASEQPLTPPDVVEGDTSFWSFIHSNLVIRESSPEKLVACIALTTGHFNAGKYAGAAHLFPITPEAVRYFREPLSLVDFTDYLAKQLEATDASRYYLLSRDKESTTLRRVSVFFTPNSAQFGYEQAKEQDPEKCYKMLQVFWPLPDLLDPPTLEQEIAKIVRWAQAKDGRMIGLDMTASRAAEVSSHPAPDIDSWSGTPPQTVVRAVKSELKRLKWKLALPSIRSWRKGVVPLFIVVLR